MRSLLSAADNVDVPTPREIAHADATARILEAGRRQLAEHGADGLSLRAVAREVGMVSSAIYRYVASRDDLLTALIIDSYDRLGEAVEHAAAARTSPGRRFVRACHAIRDWGRANPHEFALLFGSPVPGYQAPQSTVAPAARVPVVLAALIAEAHRAGSLTETQEKPLSRALAAQARTTRAALGHTDDMTDAEVLRLLTAWSTVTGFVGFELTGQLVGSFDPADAAASYTFSGVAHAVGFSDL